MKTSQAIEIVEAQAIARYAGGTPAERGSMSKIKNGARVSPLLTNQYLLVIRW
jgi:hypothetical protein